MIQPDKMNRVDRKVLEDVAKAGWSDVGVFPTRPEHGPPFNYTVGLVLHDHPEVLGMGMTNEQMHGVLASVYWEVAHGMKFEANSYSDQVLKGLRVAFVEIDDLHGDYPLSMATRLYDVDQALQLVWPDPYDRFPWDPAFEEKYRDRQVLLGTWKEP